MKCLLGVLILAVSLAAEAYCSDRQGALPQPVKVVVELTDGSRIVGRPSRETLRIRTDSLGPVWVPYSQVKSAHPADDGPWVVHSVDGSTLRGELIDAKFGLETAFGKIYVSARHVRSLTAAQPPKRAEQPAVRPPADPGLVAHWKFDDGSGSVATDSSGNANHGTIHGATWVTHVAPIEGGSHALSFDGTDDYVSVPDSDSLDLTTQGTIQLWAQISATHSTGKGTSVLAKMTHTSAVSYDFRVDSRNKLSTYLWDGTPASPRPVEYDTVVTDDTWHHFAMTWDQPTGIRLYVDGDLHDQTNLDNRGAIASSWPIWIGRARYAPNATFYYVKGKVDQIKLYNYARTPEQIGTYARDTDG